MTSKTTKFRSLFLAALMVMSVFAGTVALSGSAAAATAGNASLSPTTVASGETATHDVSFEINDISTDGSEDVTLTLPAGEFAAQDLSVTGASVDDVDVDGDTATFTITPSASTVTISGTVTVDHADVDEDTSGPITLEVTDSDGDDVSQDLATVTIIAADVNLDSSDLLFAGQEAFFQSDLSEGDTIRVVRDPDDDEETVGQLEVDEDGLIRVDTEDLENDDYVLRNNGNDIVSFEIIVQNLDTEFDPDEVDDDENSTLEVESNRATDFNVTVEADGLSTDDLLDIFADVGAFENEDDDVEFEMSDGEDINAIFDDIDNDDYELNFSVTDSTAESSASVTVTEADDEELDFNESSVSVETGDSGEISVLFSEDTDTGFLRVGDEDIGYNVTYEIVDEDEDGIANFTLNTWNTDTNDGGLSSDDGNDASVDFLDSEFPSDTVSGALDAGNYDMEVARNSEDLGNAPDAVGTFAVTDRATTSAAPWVTYGEVVNDIEDGDDVIEAIEDGDVTQRRDVAQEDFAVIQVQASGIFGFLESAEDASGGIAGAVGEVDDADATEAISLQVEQANPNPNTEAKVIPNDELTYVLDDERNMLFIVVPTTGVSDVNIEDGDRYNVTFEVNQDTELNDAKRDERVSATFDVTEREAPLETNAEDLVEIEQSEEATVSGTSTIAPGSEVTVRLRSVSGAENPFVMSETVNVSSDGTYNATFDFGDTPVGTNFTATVSASPSLDGETEWDGVVIEEQEEETPTPTPTEETPTPTEETPTPTPTPTATPTDDGTPTPTEETTTTTPGFGAVVAILALIGAAMLALRRNN